jgi:CheY-like chemotaxis protein
MAKPNVLLAEDNKDDVYLIREALREHHLEVQMRVASNGKEVLEIIAGTSPSELSIDAYSLIILDLNLPRHDGIEILQRLKESAWSGRAAVVVLTSSDSPRDKEAATALGAARYLSKPCDLDQFMALGSVFKELLESKQVKGASHED